MHKHNNTLELYKKAIRAKFEIEKDGVHSDFLISPSRAKLRKFCLEIFKLNQNPNDLVIFSSFFKFDFSPTCSGKLKDQTDKFRPIETFFKGETDLSDIEAVNMAAILVDFQPRPYLKFAKSNWCTSAPENCDKPLIDSNVEVENHIKTEAKIETPETKSAQFLNNVKDIFREKVSKKNETNNSWYCIGFLFWICNKSLLFFKKRLIIYRGNKAHRYFLLVIAFSANSNVILMLAIKFSFNLRPHITE